MDYKIERDFIHYTDKCEAEIARLRAIIKKINELINETGQMAKRSSRD